jgi:hypothetical protein
MGIDLVNLIVYLIIFTIIAILAYGISNKIPDPTLKVIVQLILLLILVLAFLERTNLLRFAR